MRLRRHLSLALASVTSLTVASALALTLTVFRHAQMRQLDQALLASATLAAEDVVSQRDRPLHLKTPGIATQGDHILKYMGLYGPDGGLLLQADRPAKAPGPAVPSLGSIGWQRGEALPRIGFDVADSRAKGHMLRGVLVSAGAVAVEDSVEKGAAPAAGLQEGRTGHGAVVDDPPLLLLLASRDDEDADILYLLQVMGGVLLGAVLVSLLVGRWVGGRLAGGIEIVADMAHRVSEGELGARITDPDGRIGQQAEIRMLARALNHMVERLLALRQAEQRFVSHAAHELRSPLTALRGELELALRHPRSSEDYRASIREALDSTDGLIALAEDLLALARVGPGVSLKASAGEATAGLQDVVQEAVRAALPRAQAATALTVEAEPVRVRGRQRDLSRMVRNLIDNALAHAPPGSSVLVRARRDGEQAVVHVEDLGQGVPVDRQERIFEPFFRGEVERGGEGTGLGLSIAREIARVHGGDLVYSRVGGVTRFVVTLPLGAEPQAPQGAAAADATSLA